MPAPLLAPLLLQGLGAAAGAFGQMRGIKAERDALKNRQSNLDRRAAASRAAIEQAYDFAPAAMNAYQLQSIQSRLEDPAGDAAMREQRQMQADQLRNAARVRGGIAQATQSSNTNLREMERLMAAQQERRAGAMGDLGTAQQEIDAQNRAVEREKLSQLAQVGLDRQIAGIDLEEELQGLKGAEAQVGMGALSSFLGGAGNLLGQKAIAEMEKGGKMSKGFKTEGEFDHDTNEQLIVDKEDLMKVLPKDLFDKVFGLTQGITTGAEYIINPEQAKKARKESPYLDKLLNKPRFK